MNGFLLLSGSLAALTAAVHIVAGGKEIARPLLGSGLKEEVKLTLYACWHLVSVAFVLSALVLLATGVGFFGTAPHSLAAFISVLWLLFGIVFLAVTLVVARPGGLFRFPQWVLLVPVGVFGLCGIV